MTEDSEHSVLVELIYLHECSAVGPAGTIREEQHPCDGDSPVLAEEAVTVEDGFDV